MAAESLHAILKKNPRHHDIKQIGNCNVCDDLSELRLGVCFNCKNFVEVLTDDHYYNVQTIDGLKKWCVKK